MPSPDDIIRFSVSLPEQLLTELDRRVTQRGYASRSELVRDLIRERLVEEAWERGTEDLIGVLTIVYDHHQRELTQRLIDIQHHEQVHVLCTTHVHLDQHNCLETIIVRGRPEEIERITTRIGGLKGVKLAKLTRTAPLEM
jgi:CopG family transcriptional regulator, nickel-responsive regulator